jgi:peptidoglycan L-alanyl-D-glutamate endopeptidase CwlK
MINRKNFVTYCLCLTFIFHCLAVKAEPSSELIFLKQSYPEAIQDVSQQDIAWKDGTHMRIRGNVAFFDKITHFLTLFRSEPSISIKDLRCDTYEPFFRKMYGNSPAEVKRNLVTVYWMPKIFGTRYPLRVTTVNGVDKKIQRISAKLEKLPPSYFKFLAEPAGSFYWRKVKREKYLSSHSFGIALDINSHYGNYWLWDLEKDRSSRRHLTYHNNIPMEIVKIFEQEGFLWGGRWYFYDTMHFEYRPELFTRTAKSELQYNNQLGGFCRG